MKRSQPNDKQSVSGHWSGVSPSEPNSSVRAILQTSSIVSESRTKVESDRVFDNWSSVLRLPACSSARIRVCKSPSDFTENMDVSSKGVVGSGGCSDIQSRILRRRSSLRRHRLEMLQFLLRMQRSLKSGVISFLCILNDLTWRCAHP